MANAALIDAESEAQFTELSHLLADVPTNLAAFVGAGLSRQANLPLWDELLVKMDQACNAHRNMPAQARKGLISQSRDKLWQAEVLHEQIDRYSNFSRFLEDTFVNAAQSGTKAFEQLVRLNFRHFLTTNYDLLIEDALKELQRQDRERFAFRDLNWEKAPDVRTFLLEFLRPDCRRHVIHIHGKADRSDTVVLTHSQYVKRYVQTLEYVDRLSVLFSTLRVVFIGFSLEDPDLRFILRQVNTRLGQSGIPHFALIGHPAGEEAAAEAAWERRRLESQFGIRSIFYDASDGHKELPGLLQTLGDQEGGRTQWLSSAARSIQPPSTPPAAAATSEAIASAKAIDESDPHKRQFGGKSSDNGWSVSATVAQKEGRDLYEVWLVVKAPATAQTGEVLFHLHPTFPHPVKPAPLKAGEARLRLLAYGAFTVGVTCGDGTRLELDLSEGDYPREFRESV